MSHDHHHHLGLSESAITPLVCGDCGGEAQGNFSCNGEQICNACDALGMEEKPQTGDTK